MTSLPSLMAVLNKPTPESSPTMKMPATFVSKFSFTRGTVRVCKTPPQATVIAEVGQTPAHFACPVHLSGCARIALPLTSSSVPVSGQISTQLPQPIQSVALMMGLGFPFPDVSVFAAVAARWTFHSASGAPQLLQKAAPFGTGLLQRGQATVSAAIAAFCEPLPAAGFFFAPI